MNRHLFLSILFLSILHGRADSQSRIVAGDTLLYHLPEPLVVTATRLPLRADRVPTPVHSVDRERIDLLPVLSLSDLLQAAGGTQATVYGAGGSLQLLSYRGLGPEYTRIYINGIPVNDTQSGLVDAGRLSLSHVGNVEIAPGGYSSLYGSGALGAVVNVSTRPSPSLIGGSVAAGSFGWNRYDIRGGFEGDAGMIDFSIESERARNDYPFSSTEQIGTGPLRRANADYHRTFATVEGKYNLGSSILSGFGQFMNSDVGIPGPFFGIEQGSARQADTDLRTGLQWQGTIDEKTLLSLSTSVTNCRQEYADPEMRIDGVPLWSLYRNFTSTISGRLEGDPFSNVRCTGGVELLYTRLESDDLTGTPRRFLIAGFLSTEFAWFPLSEDSSRVIRFYPSLRAEYAADQPEMEPRFLFTPALGLNIPLIDDHLLFRGKVGRNIRLPTFNQLYWIQGGNPDLRPEHSVTIDAGILIGSSGDRYSLGIDYFHHDVQDKIVWVPGTGIYWSPKNIRHVGIDGLSSNLRYDIVGDLVRFEGNAHWIRARKLNSGFEGDQTAGKYLPYVPVWSGTAILSLRLGPVGFSLTEELTGKRYTDEINSEENALPFHAVTGAALRIRLGMERWSLVLKLEGGNLTNRQYAMVAFYPMPSRWYRATVTVHYL